MKINPHIFRGYDLRGLVDQDLSPEIVEHLGKAYGTFLTRREIKKVVIGRDCRLTSQPYSQAMIKGLLSTGIEVIDLGLSLAGTIYWAQYYFQAKGCVSVSASHNPAEYNGFKFGKGFSQTLEGEDIQELRQISEKGQFVQGEGLVRKEDVQEFYFADLLKRFSLPLDFKVVIDPGHATAGAFIPELLERAGCQVIAQHCQLDGSFPLGAPDPTERGLAERLSRKVQETGADIGFSYDSDGDRIGVVDEKGVILWNDILVALFSSAVLEKNPRGKIVYNTLCSKVVPDVIKEKNGQGIMWRTGHSFIKAKAQQEKALFAGELSGHFYFLDKFYPHDDGCYSTLRLLSYLSEKKKTLSEAISSFPQYISSPEIKVFCPDEKKAELIKKVAPILKKDFSQGEIVDDERAGDGIRVDLAEEMFIIRYSQNGPYLTIKFEAKTEARYGFLKNYIRKLLQGYEEVDWSSTINVNIDSLN